MQELLSKTTVHNADRYLPMQELLKDICDRAIVMGTLKSTFSQVIKYIREIDIFDDNDSEEERENARYDTIQALKRQLAVSIKQYAAERGSNANVSGNYDFETKQHSLSIYFPQTREMIFISEHEETAIAQPWQATMTVQ